MRIRELLPAHLGGPVDNLWNRLIGGSYEKDVIDFYERHAPYDISVDIGAGVGYHTRRLAKISNKVIAIEPIADLVGMPSNVEIHKVAVGRKRGIEKMGVFGTYTDGSLGAGSSLVAREQRQKTEVEVVPLDEIVAEADFLKIDVEGYELEVLEPSSILNSVDFAVIELHDVKNLVDYQTRIFKLLKDFQVFASEIRSYVTLNDILLKERKDKNAKRSGSLNNHRLLCVRK